MLGRCFILLTSRDPPPPHRRPIPWWRVCVCVRVRACVWVGERGAEERKRGVQIARVEMRVGGSMRRIPLKIMPDEEEPGRFVIAQRDQETQEIIPQLKRGQKRFVEKGKDGYWKESKG